MVQSFGLSASGSTSNCTWTPPRLNPTDTNPTYKITLRQIGENRGGPIYESCTNAQRRKQKEWLAQNIYKPKPIEPKPIVSISQYPTSCKGTPNRTVCTSCIEKSLLATIGSFTDLLTHTDGSIGTVTEQQVIGQSQQCQIKNNKRTCTFCTTWIKKPKPTVSISLYPTSCKGTSNRTVCKSCIEKSLPATIGSFTDLLTHTDGSIGTVTEQQVIGQSQQCQIKNNKKTCTFCTTWNEAKGEVQAYLPHACKNNSECTLVYTTCCGCDLGEKALFAVHVNNKSKYYKSLQDRLSCNENCHNGNFNSSAECRRTAICVSGTCLAADSGGLPGNTDGGGSTTFGSSGNVQ